MCGFMVSTTAKLAKEKFTTEFQKISYRGPDSTKIIFDDHGIIGFHRLAIMDLSKDGMQPFLKDNKYLVCNGEIYNYNTLRKQLKEKYQFASNSDCEVLLPLYLEYGTEMFSKLDAEFALVIFDKDKNDFIAARDSIGIRPLFYGYEIDTSKIIFASEAKSLVDICNEVKPFPPGYYYEQGQFKCYHDATKFTKLNNDSLEVITSEIKTKFIGGVLKRLDADAPLGFLLSGGLDSSLVCSIAAKHLPTKIKTFAIGMEKDAIDLKYAKEVAEYIGSDHIEVIITKDDVLNALEEVIYNLETWDITTIRASLGMYLLSKYIKENTDVKVLLTGEISDELFGYKYTDFAPSADAFQQESQKRIRELYMYDVLRADRCISSCSLEARVPFGDLDFVDYVMGIDPKIKMNTYGKGKYLLRKAFEGDYLPNSILYREKAAFSDAVGHSLVDYLKAYANEYYTDEEFLEKKEQYKYCQPFTKESLLYRELFTKYYQGNEKLIVDYWMPNKEWESCQVDDPSARVLKNYGDSGK